jgi:hypothetical protein
MIVNISRMKQENMGDDAVHEVDFEGIPLEKTHPLDKKACEGRRKTTSNRQLT